MKPWKLHVFRQDGTLWFSCPYWTEREATEAGERIVTAENHRRNHGITTTVEKLAA